MNDSVCKAQHDRMSNSGDQRLDEQRLVGRRLDEQQFGEQRLRRRVCGEGYASPERLN
jgi:hypothetical protein